MEPELSPPRPFQWVWSVVTFFVALFFLVAGTFVGGLIFGSPEVIKALVNGRVISRALVLFLIVPSIVFLCMRGKIGGEAAIAALSSVAAYVLGEAAVSG